MAVLIRVQFALKETESRVLLEYLIFNMSVVFFKIERGFLTSCTSLDAISPIEDNRFIFSSSKFMFNFLISVCILLISNSLVRFSSSFFILLSSAWSIDFLIDGNRYINLCFRT